MPLVKRKDDETRGEDHNEKIVDDAVSDQEERMSLMVTAIGDLDEDDDFTKSGLPEISALEDVTGFDDITAKERDEAFASYNS